MFPDIGGAIVDAITSAGGIVGIAQQAKEAVSTVWETTKETAQEIGDTATAALASLSFKGSMGNKVTATQPISLAAKFFVVSEDDAVLHGRPLCQRVEIGTLSGFILCDGAVIETPGTQVENEAIEQFMTRGFFFE